MIANCIIDQRRVEFVLLCEDPAQATSVMLENPPTNYTEMFAMNGDQFYSKPCFRLLWSPYGIGQTIIFLPCGYYLSFYLFYFLA